jgi:hypothetical protein
MASLVLIAIVLTALMNFFIGSSQQLRVAHTKFVATNLARLKLVEQLNYNFANLTSSSFSKVSADYPKYQFKVIVNKLDTNLKEIRVIVKDRKKIRAKLVTIASDSLAQ